MRQASAKRRGSCLHLSASTPELPLASQRLFQPRCARSRSLSYVFSSTAPVPRALSGLNPQHPAASVVNVAEKPAHPAPAGTMPYYRACNRTQKARQRSTKVSGGARARGRANKRKLLGRCRRVLRAECEMGTGLEKRDGEFVGPSGAARRRGRCGAAPHNRAPAPSRYPYLPRPAGPADRFSPRNPTPPQTPEQGQGGT